MAYETIACRQYRNSDLAVKDLAARLNGPASCAAQKARLAAELRRETGSLLMCGAYSARLRDCENCRAISAQRRLLAELVLEKAAQPDCCLPAVRARRELYANGRSYGRG